MKAAPARAARAADDDGSSVGMEAAPVGVARAANDDGSGAGGGGRWERASDDGGRGRERRGDGCGAGGSNAGGERRQGWHGRRWPVGASERRRWTTTGAAWGWRRRKRERRGRRTTTGALRAVVSAADNDGSGAGGERRLERCRRRRPVGASEQRRQRSPFCACEVTTKPSIAVPSTASSPIWVLLLAAPLSSRRRPSSLLSIRCSRGQARNRRWRPVTASRSPGRRSSSCGPTAVPLRPLPSQPGMTSGAR